MDVRHVDATHLRHYWSLPVQAWVELIVRSHRGNLGDSAGKQSLKSLCFQLFNSRIRASTFLLVYECIMMLVLKFWRTKWMPWQPTAFQWQCSDPATWGDRLENFYANKGNLEDPKAAMLPCHPATSYPTCPTWQLTGSWWHRVPPLQGQTLIILISSLEFHHVLPTQSEHVWTCLPNLAGRQELRGWHGAFDLSRAALLARVGVGQKKWRYTGTVYGGIQQESANLRIGRYTCFGLFKYHFSLLLLVH